MSAYMPACLERSLVPTEHHPTRRELRQRYHPVPPGSPAEEEWVQEHLHLVKSIVGRITMTLPAHVDPEDLYSAGLVGLLNAVRSYDPRSGTAFETYARVRIRGSIFDELRRLDWVPRSVHSKARRVQAVMQELEQKTGQVPTETEMARALKISVSEYRQLLNEIRPATFVCLDSVQNNDGEDGPSHYEGIADQSQESPVEGVARRR
jgi:RNA polymerase sigma factor for flagellar operon FliA